ncbi:fetuin B [Alosa sapidissima]|uniref:fetuin B n=1 Tax=Alosa sapidissima TaxID=34773 RepID=UPI001C0A4C61|nr:fetuin B [Alosa sapidissima]
MKQCVLLLLAVACVHAAPVDVLAPGSCKDAVALGAAQQALNKINADRSEGYVFGLHRLSNVHQMLHGKNGIVFYLTLDVEETKCHVLSKKSYKDCAIRQDDENPVYGQCKATIFMNRVARVARLYKYSCTIRPVPASKITKKCPDCPTEQALDDQEVLKTMKMGMEKFNKESGLTNYFVPLNVTKATYSSGMATFYNVEFTIQETACDNSTDLTDIAKCEPMSCEFAHKGLCKATHSHAPTGDENISVKCDIFEPEGAEKEKTQHLLGGETDHSHDATKTDRSLGHDHEHDHTAVHKHEHSHSGHEHDHAHDHSQEHSHGHGHDHAHDGHEEGHTHHHTHEHGQGHGHAHSHDHAHDHDHVHAHHVKAHDHTQDKGDNMHHKYAHGLEDTHDHDHELALDHDHKHRHLHEHEHHHHHHEHEHEHKVARRPNGFVNVVASMDKPMILPAFPDQPVADGEKPTKLALHPDPEIPGEREPAIKPFPTTLSAECPIVAPESPTLVDELFAQDPLFKIAA